MKGPAIHISQEMMDGLSRAKRAWRWSLGCRTVEDIAERLESEIKWHRGLTSALASSRRLEKYAQMLIDKIEEERRQDKK